MPWDLFQQVGLVVAVLASASVAVRLAAGRRIGDALRRRFVMGVPLGSLLSVAGVLAVYLLVQGGLAHWSNPVVLPFRAWSYFSPVGIAFAGLAHIGPGHLYANLAGTLTLGVVAEYAWGHFPARRGASSFGSLRTNPFARAAGFGVVTWVAGVVTALFALGPAVGFSGVVFALAGVGLVRYPVGTVLALLAGRVLGLLRTALRDPVVGPVGPEPSFGGPWWANIAIQGHAFGLLLGVVVGVIVFRNRDRAPDPARLWGAVLLFAVSQSLWAVYVPAGNASYVLYRAVGLGAVFALAALVAAGATGSHRTLIERIDLSTREGATIVLAAALLAVGAVAVPYNTATIDGPGPELADDPGISVDGYEVYYAENVTHRYVASVEIPGYSQATNVRTGGVIVVNDRREMWWPAVSRNRLAFSGEVGVPLGGVGWRREVTANRTGWNVLGDSPAYRVTLREGSRTRLAYTSPPANVSATIDGRNISIAPDERFSLVVTRRNRTLGTVPIPRSNATVAAGGLRFRRNGTRVAVLHNETRVTIAAKESYN